MSKLMNTSGKPLTKNLLCVGINSNQTLTTTGILTLNLNQMISQSGDKFILENGKVYIGKGLSKIRINGKCTISLTASTGTACNLTYNKNGSEIAVCMTSAINSININYNLPLTSRTIDVSEGDYFEVKVYAKKDDSVISVASRTYFEFEEIN